MFPKDTARFSPVKGDDNKTQYYSMDTEWVAAFKPGVCLKKIDSNNLSGLKNAAVELEEAPVYIYGEYFGKGIQKCGGRYGDKNDFIVFDIDKQGWWLPRDMREAYCKGLDLKTVPFIGSSTLADFEAMVIKGFETKLPGVKDPSLIEEGIVARPSVPIMDSRGNRIIAKIKYRDYREWEDARKEFTDEEFKEFNDWYNENIEKIY